MTTIMPVPPRETVRAAGAGERPRSGNRSAASADNAAVPARGRRNKKSLLEPRGFQEAWSIHRVRLSAIGCSPEVPRVGAKKPIKPKAEGAERLGSPVRGRNHRN